MKKLERLFAIVGLMSGCGQTANVGELPCAGGALCQELQITEPLTLSQVHTANVAMLAPTWTKTEFAPVATRVSTLATAADGGLWLFRGTDTNLIATRLDANGNVLGEQRIDPPAGLATVPGFGAIYDSRGASNHALGPVLALDWAKLCLEQDGNVPSVCTHSELLVFGNDANTAVSHIDASEYRFWNDSVRSAFRSARGDAVFVPLLPDEIRMVDLSGKLLWKVDLPSALGKDVELHDGYTPPSSSGGLDADGSLLLPLALAQISGGIYVGWDVPGILLRQPEAGGAPTFDKYLNMEVQPPDGFEVKPGYQSGLALDARKRRLLTHQLVGGDLAVLRLDGAVADGFRVLREGYLDLELGYSAMDPAGTLHVAVNSGGRESADQHALLCSFPMEGAASCVQIPELPGSIQAPAPGKVYALTKQGLVRYDR